MENKDIHNDFYDSEVRDFLAKELTQARIECDLSFVSVEYVEKQIREFQRILKYVKKVRAIRCLIAEKKWEEHDISDEVRYDKKTYFPFIGTKEEYDKLMKQSDDESDEQSV